MAPALRLAVEYRPLAEIRVDPGNPHTHTDAQVAAIARSIEAFGFDNPILVGPDGVIIAAEARRQAAERLGLAEAPVIVLGHLTPAQYQAFRIADNKLAEGAGWDEALLAGVLQDLDGQDFDLSLTGFSDAELDELLADVLGVEGPRLPSCPPRSIADADRPAPFEFEWGAVVPDAPPAQAEGPWLCDADELPPVPSNPVTERGDCWLLGRHVVHCGDSTVGEDVGRLLDGKEADMLFSSPPYNVGVDYDRHDDKATSWSEYRRLVSGVLAAWVPVLRRGRIVGWNIGGSPKTYAHRQMCAMEDAGLSHWRTIIWRKIGVPIPLWHNTVADPTARNFHPNYTFEFVLLFSKGRVERGGPIAPDPLCTNDVFSLHQSQATMGLPSGETKTDAAPGLDRRPEKAHPAAYPVRLPRMFIACLADTDSIVVDPFLGSGSTLIAAELEGRRCYGMELSPAYCDLAVWRWQRFTGRQACHRDGRPFEVVAESRRG